MTGATLQRPEVWRPAAARVPLLLHGTGRNEHDLLPLAERLAPAAPVLSVRGTVLEDGMPRFFRQLAEGVFDEDDLRERVGELAEFLIAAAKEYEAGSWTLVGFSNGAIIASALLMLHPETLTAAVLLGAIVSFSAPPDVDLTGKRVRVANGQRDQWLPQRTPQPSSASCTRVERRPPSSCRPRAHGRSAPPVAHRRVPARGARPRPLIPSQLLVPVRRAVVDAPPHLPGGGSAAWRACRTTPGRNPCCSDAGLPIEIGQCRSSATAPPSWAPASEAGERSVTRRSSCPGSRLDDMHPR